MKIRSITHKWIFNTFALITLILVTVNVILIVNIKKYYYDYAEQKLNSIATNNTYIIQSMASSSKMLNAEIRNLIEKFPTSDKISVFGLDFYGNIVASSNGILTTYSSDPAAYKNSISYSQPYVLRTEYFKSGEHVMTYTKAISTINNEFSAILYMVSLRDIDSLIANLTMTSIIISLIILSLVFISGIFFVNSFVKPVREINSVIKKIAAGNKNVRINKKSNYEIEELCKSINYMADELANSEYIKNEFISSISHELRTPLTAIQGWSETILDTSYNDKETINKGMIVISKETSRLADMVEDLLDFSRIQNDRFQLNKDKMDLFVELEEAVLIYSDIALREGKKLIYNEQEAIPLIYGDKNRIRQVFINIIDNAIKYSNRGGSINVDAHVESPNAVIKISDTGCGISEQDLPHITKKFFKANFSKKGSGIGLSIVEEIIKRHNGSLNFQSVENKGTQVTITFPLYKEIDTASD